MLHGSYHGLPFRVLKVDSYAKSLVYSGDLTQPVCVHLDFTGTITVSPENLGQADVVASMEPEFEPETAGPNIKLPGLPALSTAELVLVVEDRLSRPRKPFLLWTYFERDGQVHKRFFCRSPGLDANGRYLPQDVRHGPTPKAKWTGFESGEGSVQFGFNIETDLPLTDLPSRSPILSNTWGMSVTNDDDFFATHVIDGEVIIDLGLAKARKVTLDMLRGWFLHPIPLGFKRAAPSPGLTMLEGGARYTYRLVDVEQPTDKPGISHYGAARLEIAHQREYTKANPYGVL